MGLFSWFFEDSERETGTRNMRLDFGVFKHEGDRGKAVTVYASSVREGRRKVKKKYPEHDVILYRKDGVEIP